MIITKTKFGYTITIPQTENNSEFKYDVRQVRAINDNDKREQKLIAELEEREKPMTFELIALIAEMEQKFIANDFSDDFNEKYHDKIRDLAEAVDNISFEYANRSKHGWCL